MRTVRSLLIAVLMIFSIFFLAMGLDVPVPHLPWRGMAARDLPIGILLIAASLAVARLWTTPPDENKAMQEWQRSRKRVR